MCVDSLFKLLLFSCVFVSVSLLVNLVYHHVREHGSKSRAGVFSLFDRLWINLDEEPAGGFSQSNDVGKHMFLFFVIPFSA